LQYVLGSYLIGPLVGKEIGDNQLCSKSCIDFGKKVLREDDIRGKTILEVGSRNVNGSLRDICMEFNPKEYIGIDIEEGSGVDSKVSVYHLPDFFQERFFDLIICTEVLEHLSMWNTAIQHMEMVLKHGGNLLLTTRSFGFKKHDYPNDYWRFEIEDIVNIFKSYDFLRLEKDNEKEPGVFLFARKSPKIEERTYWYRESLEMYSMEKEKRITTSELCRG